MVGQFYSLENLVTKELLDFNVNKKEYINVKKIIDLLQRGTEIQIHYLR